MKRILSFIVAAMFAGQAWAATTFTVNGLKYTVIDEENHYVTVTNGSTKPTGVLEIPSQVTYPETDGVTYTVTSLPEYAFNFCYGLKSVIIPNSVTSIGRIAFQGCSSLTTVIIPNSVMSIDHNPFHYCVNLKEINVESANTAYTSENGILFNKDKTTILRYPAGKTETTYTIPDGVINIGYSAFSWCSSLKSVTISNSVTTIDGMAFLECKNLTSVTIGNSVTSIGDQSFDECKSLTSVIIPNSVKNISSFAFARCTSLTSVSIPESVTSIGSSAFTGCSLLSYNTYDNAKYLGNNENPYVVLMSSITRDITSCIINENCKFIYNGAFYNCSGLTSICYEGNSQPICNNRSSSFYNVNNSIPVYVPMNYASDKWCGFKVSRHNLVTIPTTATCTEAGLSEGRSCTCCEKVLIAQNEIPALGHDYDTPTYTWSTEGKSCTATAVCQRNENHIVTENATITNEVTIAATCEEMGTTTYTATFENEPFTTQTKDVVDIPALQHNYGTPTYTWSVDGKSCTATAVCQRDANHIATEEVTATSEETVAATCEEMGTTTYTAVFENELFEMQTKDVVDVPATGHSYSSTLTAPTCTADGYTTHTCSVCEYTYNSDSVAAKGHSYSNTVTDPTCTEVGYTTHSCSVCEYTYNSDTVAAKGHKADSIEFENQIAATCTVVGSYDSVVYCSVCQAELFREEKEILALGHSYNSTVTAPTCTAVGFTTHTCSVCEHTYYSDTIAAKGHKADSVEFENIVPATCTAAGSKDSVVFCSVCEVELSREERAIPALGHTYNNTVIVPTCTAVGCTTHTCSVCEYTYNSDTIAASGHTEVVDAAIAATCTAAGKTEGKHCSVCDAVLVAQEEVAALGHKFKDYVYNNDATTDADGTETATCERGCGATDTRVAEGTKLLEPEKGTAVSEVASTLNIYAHGNTIVVENATDEISIYNAMGTLIRRDATHCVRVEIPVTAPGIYIVKVGGMAKRVMVE